MTNDTRLPKPEVRGEGRVLYVCAECKGMMDPEQAVIVDGLSYHPEHTPEVTHGR